MGMTFVVCILVHFVLKGFSVDALLAKLDDIEYYGSRRRFAYDASGTSTFIPMPLASKNTIQHSSTVKKADVV